MREPECHSNLIWIRPSKRTAEMAPESLHEGGKESDAANAARVPGMWHHRLEQAHHTPVLPQIASSQPLLPCAYHTNKFPEGQRRKKRCRHVRRFLWRTKPSHRPSSQHADAFRSAH